jgi:mycofactocin precursor
MVRHGIPTPEGPQMNLTEPDQTAPAIDTATVDPTVDAAAEPQLVATDLIEEVSIDGMCGVY